jgi:RNA polymerase sigma factor (sigma-70 family)
MSKRPRQPLGTIVQGCLAGESQAWHELIDVIAPVIFSLCRKSKLSRDESFDIFGQVCYELLGTIRSLKDPEKVLSFVATITRRQIYTFYQKMQLIHYLDEELIHLLPDKRENAPDELYESKDVRQVLFGAMLELPRRDFQLIKMLFFEPGEPSYEEIGRRLGMPVSSIGPTRAKALAKLCKILKRKRWKI